MILRVKVVHNPDALPTTSIVDEQGEPVTFAGADVQFHTLCQMGIGIAHIAVLIQDIPVECLGSPEFHEVKEPLLA